MSITVAAALLVVLGVLVAGVLSMGRQGKEAAYRSNKLMQLRIAAQFAAITLIVILVALGGS
jgi:hypothetical protein